MSSECVYCQESYDVWMDVCVGEYNNLSDFFSIVLKKYMIIVMGEIISKQ